MQSITEEKSKHTTCLPPGLSLIELKKHLGVNTYNFASLSTCQHCMQYLYTLQPVVFEGAGYYMGDQPQVGCYVFSVSKKGNVSSSKIKTSDTIKWTHIAPQPSKTVIVNALITAENMDDSEEKIDSVVAETGLPKDVVVEGVVTLECDTTDDAVDVLMDHVTKAVKAITTQMRDDYMNVYSKIIDNGGCVRTIVVDADGRLDSKEGDLTRGWDVQAGIQEKSGGMKVLFKMKGHMSLHTEGKSFVKESNALFKREAPTHEEYAGMRPFNKELCTYGAIYQIFCNIMVDDKDETGKVVGKRYAISPQDLNVIEARISQAVVFTESHMQGFGLTETCRAMRISFINNNIAEQIACSDNDRLKIIADEIGSILSKNDCSPERGLGRLIRIGSISSGNDLILRFSDKTHQNATYYVNPNTKVLVNKSDPHSFERSGGRFGFRVNDNASVNVKDAKHWESNTRFQQYIDDPRRPVGNVAGPNCKHHNRKSTPRYPNNRGGKGGLSRTVKCRSGSPKSQ